MAQLVVPGGLRALLRLDARVPGAAPARWQRGAQEASGPAGANGSRSAGRTPGRAPGRCRSRSQTRSSERGGDRYIPRRSAARMEVAGFLLSEEGRSQSSQTPTKRERQKAWAAALSGVDVARAQVLGLSGTPQAAPEGSGFGPSVLCSQQAAPGPRQRARRHIRPRPERVLDAPGIRSGSSPNLLDWSSGDVLAVALDSGVYLRSAGTGDVLQLLRMQRPGAYVSSVSWSKAGSHLAVGTSRAEVQLWDVQEQKLLRNMASHSARVGALCWSSCMLSSGSRSGHIHHHDVRVAEHHVATLRGHRQEVCGLRWSPDGRRLASGGKDKLVHVWPDAALGAGWVPLQTFAQHQGAVKAVAWCPWQSSVLATGGGTGDGHIRLWNVCSGACLNAVDAHSQVCAILWSSHYKELVSGHGLAQNQLVIWKYPTMAKVAELKGHRARVLSLAMSPDGATVASVAADETIRLWRCFELDPARQREREKASAAKSSIIHQGIR